MTNKSAKQFGKEMVAAFGDIEWRLSNNQTGQVVQSESYVDEPKGHEIDGGDYLAMGGDKHYDINEGALAGILALHFKAKK